MKFLIQTYEGKVTHDFSFTLMESCRFLNWIEEGSAEYKLTDEIIESDYIPIGSVEFVIDYLKTFYNKIPKPINVPNDLNNFAFTHRNIINGTEKDIVGEKFVKSNDKIKSFTEICSEAPSGNYQISDLIEIDSEWRAFIYQNKLVGLQNYSGDFTMFPDVNKIELMINKYESSPIAYTLDVGIFRNNTFVIEVHDFFSCGLYGFSNHKILPYMFSRWFYEFIKYRL